MSIIVSVFILAVGRQRAQPVQDATHRCLPLTRPPHRHGRLHPPPPHHLHVQEAEAAGGRSRVPCQQTICYDSYVKHWKCVCILYECCPCQQRERLATGSLFVPTNHSATHVSSVRGWQQESSLC